MFSPQEVIKTENANEKIVQTMNIALFRRCKEKFGFKINIVKTVASTYFDR